MRSELKRLISVSAKTLVIMNKEFKNTPYRVSRSTTQRRGVIQAGNSYEKDASPKLTNGPSVATEAKNGGSFQIAKMEGHTGPVALWSGTASPLEMKKVHTQRWEGKIL